MKTTMSENEANRVAVDTVSLALQKLPYNAQDEADKEAAVHFLYKGIAKIVNSRLTKIEDKIKDAFKKLDVENQVVLTQHYRIEAVRGSSRTMFDLDTFATMLSEKYPTVPKHVIIEIASKATKMSSPSTSIDVEYVGDVARG
jgi:hypothetical protein